MNKPVIELKNIKKYFPVRKNSLSGRHKFIHAVENVSFKIFPRETVGIVGESGCGKTIIGRMIVRLEKPTGGEIYFKSNNIYHLKRKKLKEYRKNIQFIFMDPYSSLNPKKIVSKIILMGIKNFHTIRERKKIKEKATEIMKQVGLTRDYLYNFPHEFSPGQIQKVSIARTIAVNPELIICDDSVSILDVSVRAQIINLIQNLKNEFHFSMLFISQDLALVKHICDRILVMYRGHIVESAPVNSLFENTSHPYTKALISATPEPKPDAYSGRILLKGDTTAFLKEQKGCCFADRCYMDRQICHQEPPLGRQLVRGHVSYCHFAEKAW